jgi:MerR family transcriptional regulator/heat shock protein HspR
VNRGGDVAAADRRGLVRPGAHGAGADEHRPVYVISVAAELAGVHPQTLRIYERRGLLDPARTGSGNRRYSEEDISLLRRIQDLTNAGVNLEGVRRILALLEENERLRAELERSRTEARDAIARTHKQYRRDLVPVPKAQLPAHWRQGRG